MSGAALPGPGLGDLPGRAALAPGVQMDCERCHAEIAAEQRASRHRSAFTNTAFQAALAEEDLPFCRGCHAPEAPTAIRPPPPLADIGVGCATCHLAGGVILAAPSDSPSPSPHPVARDPRFATEAACAGCHEFDFPADHRGRVPGQMQLTVTEHAGSPYAEIACAGCHMPPVGEGARRHRSHALVGSRSVEAQAQALRVTAGRDGGRVLVTVEPGEVGHAYPTGDLFRRLAVRVEAATPQGALVARGVRHLARHFERGREPNGAPRVALVRDDRPGAPGPSAGGIDVDFDLGAAAAVHPISVQIVFERVAKIPEGHPETEAAVESESLLWSAVLPPTPARQ